MNISYRLSALALWLLTTPVTLVATPFPIDLSSDHCTGDRAQTTVCARTTYYVGPGGSNRNPGTRAQPFGTIQYAFNTMSGGDEVVLLDGTYNTTNEVGIYFRSGTATQPTLIRAQNRWGAKIRTSAQYQAFTVQDSDYVTIEGIEVAVRDPASQAFVSTSGFSTFRSNHVTIRDCYAHDFGCNGFSFQGGDYFTLENSVARDNAKTSPLNCSGISIYQPKQLDNAVGYHNVIRGNVSFENEVNIPFENGEVRSDQPTDGNGIILDDFNNTQNGSANGKFTAASLIENNLCYNNGGSGVKVFETENVMVRHNTCWHNLTILRFYPGRFGEIDVSFTLGADITVANNIAVSRDEANTWAMNYTPAINPTNGYLQRYSNILVGAVRMPGNRFWDAYGDQVTTRGDQGYIGFVNPTVTLTGGINGVGDFDRYFRLTTGSAGVDQGYAGRDYLGRNVFNNRDLEGAGRPQGNARDIGCYEGTTGRRGSNVTGGVGSSPVNTNRGTTDHSNGRSGTDALETLTTRNDLRLTSTVLPNPTGGELTLRLDTDAAISGATLAITGTTGKVHWRERIDVPVGRSNRLLALTPGEYPAGVYLLRLTDAGGRLVVTHRVLINR